jgi:hypothetical protein
MESCARWDLRSYRTTKRFLIEAAVPKIGSIRQRGKPSRPPARSSRMLLAALALHRDRPWLRSAPPRRQRLSTRPCPCSLGFFLFAAINLRKALMAASVRGSRMTAKKPIIAEAMSKERHRIPSLVTVEVLRHRTPLLVLVAVELQRHFWGKIKFRVRRRHRIRLPAWPRRWSPPCSRSRSSARAPRS